MFIGSCIAKLCPEDVHHYWSSRAAFQAFDSVCEIHAGARVDFELKVEAVSPAAMKCIEGGSQIILFINIYKGYLTDCSRMGWQYALRSRRFRVHNFAGEMQVPVFRLYKEIAGALQSIVNSS